MISVVALTGCTPTVNKSLLPCAGWKDIPVKTGTAVYLSNKDTLAAKRIITHNEFGKELGCW